MKNHHRIPEGDLYRIRVNKKRSNNNNTHKQNYIVYSNNINSTKFYHLNTHIPSYNAIKNISSLNLLKSTNNANNSIIASYPYSYQVCTKIIKCKNNSNSEEKIRKGNLNINCLDDQNQKDGNILEDLINNKYLKPILDSQDIDEKLLNCNLKEPIKNTFNVSLNDFFNRKKKCLDNARTPKMKMGKDRGHKLFIKTNNFNNNNYLNNDIVIHNNRTIENNNANNYYNDIQMTNNYYNNNEINLLNFPLYNNNFVHFSSEEKKLKELPYNNNPLIYYSYERNKSNSKHNTYKSNNIKYVQYLNDENNYSYYNCNYNNYNYKYPNEYNNSYSPVMSYFKSNTYTEKKSKPFIGNYVNYKPNRNTYNNKEINIRHIGNIVTLGPIHGQMNEKNEKVGHKNNNNNNKYDNIKNILKHNNSKKQNKYDYNKKLFDIYRGKLITEFFRHIEKVIMKYLARIFRMFIDFDLNKKASNKIDEIFIPKISLEKNKIDDKTDMRGSANVKKKTYFKIFYSDKKFPQNQNYLKLPIKKNNITSVNKTKINTVSKKDKNINNSAIINNNLLKNEKILNINNKLYENVKLKNSLDKKDYPNLISSNRNSMFSNNTTKNKNIQNNNNLKIIDVNNPKGQYIYKKKVKINKNATFKNKINNNNLKLNENRNSSNHKDSSYKDDILSNSKGKIIDIDINLGKPIKAISDISPLENMFINDYNNKKFKTSYSTNNKRVRKKRKNKNQKFSLPKKKYLEEGYDDDSFPVQKEENNITYNRNNSFDKRNFISNNINLNNSYNLKNDDNYFKNFFSKSNENLQNENKKKKKNYKNILVKNIMTSDKRLFIHINYIASLIPNKNIMIQKKTKYISSLLQIKRDIFFSIIITNKNRKKSAKNNSFFAVGTSRNYVDDCFEENYENINKTIYKNNKDKYLNSCVKFMIKSINKVFLNKDFKYFLNIIKDKSNKTRKVENNKYKISTYKKKTSKGKVQNI